jgi:quercetin dioxygenase-like cupin family protein
MKIEIKRFDSPDETRLFEKGKFELVTLGGTTLGRATYEPGWKWSEHVGPLSGERSCQVEHLGLVVSGRVTVRMDDGTQIELGPSSVFSVPPGHDSWVIGDEPYVSIHFAGAGEYAK